MDGSFAGFVMSLLAGGVGGNVAGLLLRKRSMGAQMNTIFGAVGGVAASQILAGGAGADLGGGAIGGVVVTLVASVFKKNPAD